MRFVKLSVAAVLLAVFELALGWRLGVLGATADLLFILACFAALELRPGEGVPAACAIGLVADFLLGERLGLMALSFGLGARAIEGIGPLLGRWRPDGGGPVWARAGGLFVATFAGAAVSHGTVALLGAFLGEASGVGARMIRGAEIAFLTAAASPAVWPVMALAIGPLVDSRSAGRAPRLPFVRRMPRAPAPPLRRVGLRGAPRPERAR